MSVCLIQDLYELFFSISCDSPLAFYHLSPGSFYLPRRTWTEQDFADLLGLSAMGVHFYASAMRMVLSGFFLLFFLSSF